MAGTVYNHNNDKILLKLFMAKWWFLFKRSDFVTQNVYDLLCIRKENIDDAAWK